MRLCSSSRIGEVRWKHKNNRACHSNPTYLILGPRSPRACKKLDKIKVKVTCMRRRYFRYELNERIYTCDGIELCLFLIYYFWIAIQHIYSPCAFLCGINEVVWVVFWFWMLDEFNCLKVLSVCLRINVVWLGVLEKQQLSWRSS